ncbi:hypothetical protein SAMN05661080_04726 [Modestobacter sp. DSM 44400]|uniref:hypothetical protein n=1 Tax=Modestobacter sp. DSM 44400 TaxID=1550230 RepID=UPI000899EDA5|nr:hypothetical protein [Modestobacter sp. DSM 44400]SDY82651.1 hypothetical protein SAMN05661080_04726 [Modestobacter sp. DSM 44400]
MTQMQRKLRKNGTSEGSAHRGMVVEPVKKPRAKPSAGYIKALVDLGASKETVEIAQGKRKYKFHVLRTPGA